MSTENKVKLKGYIAHMYITEKVVIVTLKTIDYRPNSPQIAFFGDMKQKIKENFSSADIVEIEGHLATEKLAPNGAKLTSLIGDTIKKTDDVLSEPEQNNTLSVSGTVVGIQRVCDNLLTMTVKTTDEEGWNAYINFLQYTITPEKVLERIFINDTVHIEGMIQTLHKLNAHGQKRYYQNAVIKSIAKQLNYKESAVG